MLPKKITLFLLFLLLKPCFSYSQELILGEESVGMASYYGSEFYGRKTSNGEILKKNEFTCAHPKLPFGTMLEVTNLVNNRWCVVRVNDRGPFSHNRIIDLSHEAADRLQMFRAGTVKVKVMIVGDHGNVIISRPESIIENSMELVDEADNEDTITVPLVRSEENSGESKTAKEKDKKKDIKKKKG